MPNWTTMTLEQMREEPLRELCESISTYIQANFTKRKVMEWLFETDTFYDPPEFTYDEHGRKTGRRQVGRFVETGKQKKNSEVTSTYYPNGDIEDITIIKRDENDDIVEQYTIHHYQDGRQPIRIDHILAPEMESQELFGDL